MTKGPVVMTEIPARDLVARLAVALARHLPERYGTILSADRFADVNAAMNRLVRPAFAAAAAAGLSDDEAERLAAVLLQRWHTLGGVRLDPMAAIVGPDEVPIGGSARYEVVTDGVDDGWTAVWTGPVRGGTAGADVEQVGAPDDPGVGDDPVGSGTAGTDVRLHPAALGPISLVARVFGRVDGHRQVIVATRTVTAVAPPVASEPVTDPATDPKAGP